MRNFIYFACAFLLSILELSASTKTAEQETERNLKKPVVPERIPLTEGSTLYEHSVSVVRDDPNDSAEEDDIWTAPLSNLKARRVRSNSIDLGEYFYKKRKGSKSGSTSTTSASSSSSE